jgi:hypothetical protein
MHHFDAEARASPFQKKIGSCLYWSSGFYGYFSRSGFVARHRITQAFPQSISTRPPPQIATGASVFWAIWGRRRGFLYGGQRFSSRAPQMPNQKPDAAHFIVDSA